MSTLADRRKKALAHWCVINNVPMNALSLAAGRSRSFVSSHVNGHAGDMKSENWISLAEGASLLKSRKVTVGELQGDLDQPQPIEIRFKVGAGAEIVRIDGDTGFGSELAPPGFVGTACQVVGDSGAPMFESDDILFIGPGEKTIDRFLNKVAVVTLKDGKCFVKRVLRGSKRGLYDLQSINPAFSLRADEAIVEAAPIRWIKRGG